MPSSNIKLFENLTPDMFRIVGILHGDGNMSFSRILITDKCKDYHITVLRPLFRKVFNLRLNLFHDQKRNSYYSHVKNKLVYNYLVAKLKIPKGSIRKNLFIPAYLKKANNNCKASYVGGIFDSEGSVSKRQAEMNLSTTCVGIHHLVKSFLRNNKIKFSQLVRNRRQNKEYEIYIYGRDNIKRLLKIVEIKHPDKLLRLKQLSLVH